MALTIRELAASTKSLREMQNPTGRVGSVTFAYSKNQRALTVRGVAQSASQNKRYEITFLIRKVDWSEVPAKGFPIQIQVKGGGFLYVAEPTVDNPVQARCSCPDYYFMWQYFNKQNKSLTGPHKPYIRKTPPPPIGRPFRNPTKTPGLCKHQLRLLAIMLREGVLKGRLNK